MGEVQRLWAEHSCRERFGRSLVLRTISFAHARDRRHALCHDWHAWDDASVVRYALRAPSSLRVAIVGRTCTRTPLMPTHPSWISLWLPPSLPSVVPCCIPCPLPWQPGAGHGPSGHPVVPQEPPQRHEESRGIHPWPRLAARQQTQPVWGAGSGIPEAHQGPAGGHGVGAGEESECGLCHPRSPGRVGTSVLLAALLSSPRPALAGGNASQAWQARTCQRVLMGHPHLPLPF